MYGRDCPELGGSTVVETLQSGNIVCNNVVPYHHKSTQPSINFFISSVNQGYIVLEEISPGLSNFHIVPSSVAAPEL